MRSSSHGSRQSGDGPTTRCARRGSPGAVRARLPLIGRDTEPTLFELSQPGRSSWQLDPRASPSCRSTSLVHSAPQAPPGIALAEVSERDLVGHFTRLSHRQYSVDLGRIRSDRAPMKYNPSSATQSAALPGLCDVHPAAPDRCTRVARAPRRARGGSLARSPAWRRRPFNRPPAPRES